MAQLAGGALQVYDKPFVYMGVVLSGAEWHRALLTKTDRSVCVQLRSVRKKRCLDAGMCRHKVPSVCHFSTDALSRSGTTDRCTVPSRRQGSRCCLAVDLPSGRKPRDAESDCYTRFRLSRQHHYLPIAQMNPFRPRPSHSAPDIQSND
jgi:hypothetical protein